MFPSTGSATWDLVLQLGIALAMLVSLILLYRNFRGR
ncbi:LPXTG cell wall anchor domain-containing protein [Geodermatophilus sp. TF02-6]|nr:LPXTG cell wall anchor domain-containing protein [Geodermatophilus sp. TF02-6]